MYTTNMQDAKEEVRSRLNIEDVIGEYVQLKRAGRSFKGLSPFTGEKSASFFVSPDKHIWHDFSSGKGGDVFAFVMEVEGMDFRQALEMLARRTGVDLSMYQGSDSQEFAKRKKRMLEMHDMAATYYQKTLLQNPHAQEYIFKKRGMNKAVVQNFRIGYAPDSGNALVPLLKRKGYSEKELKDGGLANQYGGDLFRGRMMVPLMDTSGQVVGFTGRIIRDDPKAPKYLNTPQTLLYDKSRHVFGLSQAKESIRKADYAVVVEGNLDVVSSHQVDIKQVVATAGTAMTEHHLRALSRLSGNIRLAFDGDKAGLAATERAIPIAQNVGVDLTIVTLTDDAKDPDELIQIGADKWQKSIDSSEPVVDWVIKQFAAREDLQTAHGKSSFTSAALSVINALKDPVEQEHYMAKIADMTDTSKEAVITKLKNAKESLATNKPLKNVKNKAPVEKMTRDRNQDALLAIALTDLKVQKLIADKEWQIFEGDERKAVAQYFAKHSSKEVQSTPSSLQQYEKYVTMLLLHPDMDNVAWNSENRIASATKQLNKLQMNYKKAKIKQMEKEARDRGDEAEADELYRQFSELIRGEKNAR